MRRTGVRPRVDQVAELTRGLRLPLEPIANDHLELLAERLQQAFDHIRVHEPTTVAMGQEREVTALMYARLNRMIEEDPLWRQLVMWVGRGSEKHQLRRVSPRESSGPVDCSVRGKPALPLGRGGEDSRHRGVENGSVVLQERNSPFCAGQVCVGQPRGIHARLRSGWIVDRSDTQSLPVGRRGFGT